MATILLMITFCSQNEYNITRQLSGDYIGIIDVSGKLQHFCYNNVTCTAAYIDVIITMLKFYTPFYLLYIVHKKCHKLNFIKFIL
jgi:hypothetical protein